VPTVFSFAALALTAQVLLAPAPALAETPIAPAAVHDEATPQSFAFAGTRWGATAAETRKALADHGFDFEQAADGGDLVFMGQLNDRPAIVIALFGEHGLTKILVSLPTQDDSTMNVYREMRQALSGQYGAPALDVERYAYPFADGHHVGFEIAALRVGKATIGAKWETNGEALGIKITEGLMVSAHYESPTWAVDAERRRQ
jgi:hypothetical protein